MVKRAAEFQRVDPRNLQTLYMLVTAFPNSIDDASYFPLLHLLYNRPNCWESDESVARSIALYSGREYGEFLNDLWGIRSGEITPASDELARVRGLLTPHGYDNGEAWERAIVVEATSPVPWWRFCRRRP